MAQVQNVTLSFGKRTLFEDVNLKFTAGNCYGLIGANGAGKSTFLKILSQEIEPTNGSVIMEPGKRLGILRQDQFAFEEYDVIDTVIMGYPELYELYAERKALYAKAEMSDEEGLRAGEVETLYGEMDGYNSEADAATLLCDLGITVDLHEKPMSSLGAGPKVRVLLAQALFGSPDLLLLDEPTNQLDYATVLWLENFLSEFKNTVIVVSHDRHFLNNVCTHIADIDFGKIKVFSGNYDFWKQASELATQQRQQQHKKNSDRIKELEEFVARFSANASKSKQATSRKKMIEKLRPEDLPESIRKAPYINFTPLKPAGTKVITVKDLNHSIDGEKVLNNVSFEVERGDKLVIAGKNSVSKTTLLQILGGEIQPDSGEVLFGESINATYFPKNNSHYFQEHLPLNDWITQYTDNTDLQWIRGYLGRMLFTGEEALKDVTVLSGGEKARAMFSRMMILGGNVLIFDEPTDHLDLEAISSLNEAMEKFTETIIYTSKDNQLLETVSNRIIEVSPAGMIDRRTDFYDYMTNPNFEDVRKSLQPA